MKIYKYGICFITLICLYGCNGCNDSASRPKPDVSSIKIDTKLLRFDQDLMNMSAQNFEQQQQGMEAKYGSFYNFYLGQFVIGPRPTGDSSDIRKQAIEKFISDSYTRRLQDSIDYYYKTTTDIEEELTNSLKYFKHYFPDSQTPKVVTINSGFSISAFTYDKDMLGIGLDLYLGNNNPDYDSAGIYQYLHHKMNRGFIARNAMEVLVNFYFGEEENERNKNLIEAMVEKGKKIYLLSYLLPDAPDSLLVGFTQTQTDWCQNSEYEIWKFLNDKDLLYKNDFMEKKRYLGEGPTTTGMPPEAPGNIGSWIGLQVVRKFAKETGNKISLRDLMLKYDGRTILQKAKYRPSKLVF